MKQKTIALLGGSGFVGRHLAARLSRDGHLVRILARRPERVRTCGVLPGVEVRAADIFDQVNMREALVGCDSAVNLVGILNENRRLSFQKAHVQLSRNVVQGCHDVGITRLLHMSSLNANAAGASSRYLRSKGEAENIAHTTGKPTIAVTSFRPSVIFGQDDSFFNRFASLLQLGPLMPLACPQARMAPVFIGDVVEAMALSLDDAKSFGSSYDLCGPHAYTLEQLVRFTASCTGSRARIQPLGDFSSRMMAAVLGMAPGKPMTLDNYRSLSQDSVCENNGLAHFGIKPTAIEGVVPKYLSSGRERDRFNRLRGDARRG